MTTLSFPERLRKWRVLGLRRLRLHRMTIRSKLRPGGVLPDFLIIGAMKSGTTSLFRMLSQHAGTVEPEVKEVQYFNQPVNHARGEGWYRAHFPTRKAMERRSEQLGYRAMTGEATPAMSAPGYAPNAARLVPDARLIVSLRDPVERAWSHYQHMRRHVLRERLSFSQALDREFDWMAQGLQLTTVNYRDLAPKLHRHGYVKRGQYAEQLEEWLKHFPKEQFLILNFEEWKRDPGIARKRMLDHIGLPDAHLEIPRANPGHYRSSMPEDCRERLVAHFRPWNRRLFDLLGEKWDWPC